MTDHEQLVKALRHCVSDEKGVTKCAGCPYYPDITGCLDRLHTDAAAAIEDLQAEVPKRGEMYVLEYDNPETGEFEQTYFQCSVCGKYFYGVDECEAKDFNYCPNCGSQMRGEVNERD